MEQYNSRSSRVRRCIIVILSILLVGSLAFNIYQYLIRPESTYMNINDGTLSNRHPISLYGDSFRWGGLQIHLDQGLQISKDSDFNLTVQYRLWNPIREEITKNITFRIFGRYLSQEYSTTPLTEKTVTLHKDKERDDATVSTGVCTLTAPSMGGTYIYKVWSGTVIQNVSITDYTFEFAVWIGTGYIVNVTIVNSNW